ncbi:MAG: hypothetical protein Ct9H90mP7_2130 [Candidatus Neomarinimicrobiota bacterium]|nr:MAG: hypothetical protein Ct9H90mP7_2130 [Candidatus Neomarinimicrobiota bacterium]
MGPDIIRLSKTFLLTVFRATLAVKSKIVEYFFFSFRDSMICSSAFVPTFLIAFSPNEMVLL